ncbi:MAG TPA: hypothetical protein VGE28_06705 [Pseudomonas sp.]
MAVDLVGAVLHGSDQLVQEGLAPVFGRITTASNTRPHVFFERDDRDDAVLISLVNIEGIRIEISINSDISGNEIGPYQYLVLTTLIEDGILQPFFRQFGKDFDTFLPNGRRLEISIFVSETRNVDHIRIQLLALPGPYIGRCHPHQQA